MVKDANGGNADERNILFGGDTLFGDLSYETFLKDYWQRQSLWVKNALPTINSLLDANDLAGLACEPDVESRIIFGSGLSGPWRCQQGPFDEADFEQLPAQDWTLLVQGVDQWDESVRNILTAFDFLPRWRLEDIMASVAPIGGGVGPHFDYYDVFLLQASGQRRWQLGQACDEHTPLQANDQVKLLTEFNTHTTLDVGPGDLLYIPAGMAHWGVASSDDCITYSVGFRAPSVRELVTTMVDHLLDELPEHMRYRDPVMGLPSDTYCIDKKAQQQVQQLIGILTEDKLKHAATKAFGELVTEPRHPPLELELEDEAPEISTAELQQLLAQHNIIVELPPHSRLAYQHTGNEMLCHINGQTYPLSQALVEAINQGVIYQGMRLTDEELAIIVSLIEQGDLFIISE